LRGMVRTPLVVQKHGRAKAVVAARAYDPAMFGNAAFKIS